MAGQAWKYSGELDERDLAFLQHEYGLYLIRQKKCIMIPFTETIVCNKT